MPTELGLIRNAWKRLFGNKAWFTGGHVEEGQKGCEQCQLMKVLGDITMKSLDVPLPSLDTSPKTATEADSIVAAHQAMLDEEKRLLEVG